MMSFVGGSASDDSDTQVANESPPAVACDLCKLLSKERQKITPPPILLVAHGLGGLVCATAVALGNQNTVDNPIKAITKDIKGIIFLTTPFGGLGLPDWAELLGRLLPPRDTDRGAVENKLAHAVSDVISKGDDDQSHAKLVFFQEELDMYSVLVNEGNASSSPRSRFGHWDLSKEEYDYRLLKQRIFEILSGNGITAALFYTSPYLTHKNDNPLRIEGTCEWFLDHPRFQDWRDSKDHDLLWLSADPGCGKSVLSRALVDERLVVKDSAEDTATVCYFFFNDNEKQNNAESAIYAMLHQLFCANPGLLGHANEAVKQSRKGIKLEFDALWDLWQSAAFDPSIGDVICVLDALDECQDPGRCELIERLVRFYQTPRREQQANSKVKFLVTSRPYQCIEENFANLVDEYPEIRVTADDQWNNISREIHTVMETRVEEIGDQRELSVEVRKALKRRFSAVQEDHVTTYLWLHLTLEKLGSCLGSTQKKLLKEINELPESVEEADEKILQRCDREDKEDGKRLLEIIVAAQRPLTLSEIDVALEVGPETRRCSDLDIEGAASRKRWIRKACGLFLKIIDSRVFLIHPTARDFLLRQPNEDVNPDGWRHSIDLRDAHQAIALKCIYTSA